MSRPNFYFLQIIVFARSYQVRVINALEEQGIESHMNLAVMRNLYPLCDASDWKVRVSLAWNGYILEIVNVEACDRYSHAYLLLFRSFSFLWFYEKAPAIFNAQYTFDFLFGFTTIFT